MAEDAPKQTSHEIQTFLNILPLFSSPVVSRSASGAAVDRYESDRQRHTAVINFLDTTRDRRTEDESRNVVATTLDYGQGGEEEDYYEDYYEEDYEDEDLSGDYDIEMPRGKITLL